MSDLLDRRLKKSNKQVKYSKVDFDEQNIQNIMDAVHAASPAQKRGRWVKRLTAVPVVAACSLLLLQYYPDTAGTDIHSAADIPARTTAEALYKHTPLAVVHENAEHEVEVATRFSNQAVEDTVASFSEFKEQQQSVGVTPFHTSVFSAHDDQEKLKEVYQNILYKISSFYSLYDVPGVTLTELEFNPESKVVHQVYASSLEHKEGDTGTVHIHQYRADLATNMKPEYHTTHKHEAIGSMKINGQTFTRYKHGEHVIVHTEISNQIHELEFSEGFGDEAIKAILNAYQPK
ncbi:hypothetical protein [Thalassobacillus hwangdonensis]|uniref:DUF4367 domain-containing protein n=1 Tax=Thalassobacillus hwangdonensis TaxID=546108 RepID=A0ABW3L1Y4_9BACI